MKTSLANHYAMMRAQAFVSSTFRELEPLGVALDLARTSIEKSIEVKNVVKEKIFFITELETMIKISNLLS